jgi:kynurenine formamidase
VKIHDVRVLVHEGMPIWPGDPKLSMRLASNIAKSGAETAHFFTTVGVHGQQRLIA